MRIPRYQQKRCNWIFEKDENGAWCKSQDVERLELENQSLLAALQTMPNWLSHRRTGRTTRILQKAIKAYEDGRNIFVVVSHQEMIKPIREMMQPMMHESKPSVVWNECRYAFIPQGSIRFITMENYMFDKNTMQVRGVPKENTFIDHSVFDIICMRNIMEQLS